jgi:hypothetical protein
MNKRFNPKVKSRVIALMKKSSIYNNDSHVIFEMNKDYLEDYINMAKKIIAQTK